MVDITILPFILQLISTILYIIGGIVSMTKYSLRARVRIYLNLFLIVANSLWMTDMIIAGDFMYTLVGALFIIMGIIGVFNFRRIHKKEKKRGDPFKIDFTLPENYYSCKKFNTEYEYCECDDCKKERGENKNDVKRIRSKG